MAGIFHLLLGRVQQAVASAVDPFFNYVTALLHGDGTNGAQNNTFLDSSTNNFTITRNGNTTQGTFSPFSQTGWSNYFDGSGDYLSVASATALNLSTGDFTIECWVYPITGINDVDGVIAKRNLSTFSGGDWRIAYRSASTAFGIACGTNNVDRLTPAIALNQWNHIAFVRSSGTLSCYANGLRGDSLTWTDNLDNAESLRIGFNAATYDFPGYISNVRIVKGTAVYSGATYTVPTAPLTAITNTSLLTCQSNRFLDASSNNFTVTPTGDVSVQAFSPFNPTSAWSASSNGGSGYFDGSGDYLSIAYNSAFNFGTGDFTIECWVYPVGNQTLYTGIATQNGSTNGWYLSFGNSNAVRFTDYATAYLTSSSSVNPNSWTHVAVTRSGTAMKMFFNGVVVASTTSSATFGEAFPVVVGFNATNYFLGYITDLRLVKGTAVYTAAFTPPTAPLTAITNTSLLLNYTNAGIYDNAAVGDYETVGNAQVSTSVKKYGTGSMAFDGTGDYLDTPSNNAFTFGTGDFTIEFWLNTSSTGFNIMNPATATGTGYWGLLVQTSNLRWNSAYNVTNLWLVDATPILNGQWNHVAICRTAGVTKAFFNGTVVATNADTTNYSGVAAWRIGSGNVAALNGYIDDFRITKYARYQYNFTPPTAAFPNIGGTVTLTADPYFRNTTLLLPGNGTNGAQNNTFLDSSSNAFTITRNGNTTQGNFSPFSQTGWGNYFDGTNSKVTMASAASMSMTGQFTIECWVYWTGTTTLYQNFIGSNDTFTSNASFFRVWGSGMVGAGSVGIGNPTHDSTSSVYAANALPINQWTHVAATRDSSNIIRVFINGTLRATGSADTSTYDFGQGGTCIGDSPWDGANGWYSGYISNLRVVKGGALYTSSFTPSTTPLTTTVSAGTVSLLTCQSNRFLDNSSNAYALTPAGNASVQAFSPFAPTAAWTASTNGGSGYFDGSGDYLTTPSNAAFGFGTGDFTIECWIWAASAFNPSLIKRVFFFSDDRNNVDMDTAGNLEYYDGSVRNLGVCPLRAWTHVAISKTSGTVSAYVNGTRTYTGAESTNTSARTFTVGAKNTGAEPWDGYIADVRILKGQGLYSGTTITVPTAPLTAITNTQLLLSTTNGGVTDATAKNDLETVGNAQISTTQSKFGGSSMYFDGAGDYLTSPDGEAWNFGSGDFTAEAWIYPASFANEPMIMGQWSGNTGGTTLNWALMFDAASAGYLRLITSSNGSTVLFDLSTSTFALSLNQWQHVAAVRYGNTFTIYVNGISRATTTNSSALYNATNQFTVGSESATPTQNFNGYIDDLRITKGIARYTSNFTPPTSAFLLQ